MHFCLCRSIAWNPHQITWSVKRFHGYEYFCEQLCLSPALILTVDIVPCSRRSQFNPGLTIWMTQNCWTCCLFLRDSAKKTRFTESCKISEAGSRTRRSSARALQPSSLSISVPFRSPSSPASGRWLREGKASLWKNLRVTVSLCSLLAIGCLLSAIRKTKPPFLSQDHCVSQKQHQ